MSICFRNRVETMIERLYNNRVRYYVYACLTFDIPIFGVIKLQFLLVVFMPVRCEVRDG